MNPFKIVRNSLFRNRLAAAKEKERRNQELKDALEESERKMQEVKIITFTNYPREDPIQITSGEECAKASGGGGEGGGGSEDPAKGEGGEAVQGDQGGDALSHGGRE